MKSDRMRESDNVEDRRGQSSGSFGGGSFGRGGGMGSGGIGLLLQLLLMGGGRSKWLILIILGFLIFGGGAGLGGILTGDQGSNSEITTQQEQPQEQDQGQEAGQEVQNQNPEAGDEVTDEEGAFLSKVLASTEDFWTETFKAEGLSYDPPQLVLYTGGTMTGGCGIGQATAGPFYCPGDSKVYIDVSFYRELQDRYQAKGEFAMAYVLAHEVGHHVQNQLGIMDDYNQARQGLSETKANQLNVRLELQADYYAGAWSHYVEGQGLLDEGDVEEAIEAAKAVGDDTIQQETYGRVVPDAFTHGSSQQRTSWFKRGYQYGDLEHGDTFKEDIDL